MSKENRHLAFTAGVSLLLIALIIASYTYGIYGREVQADQPEVSVVLYSAGTGGWASLLEGMKRAEEDYSINIDYVLLRENADAYEQLDMVKREIENGAEGVIVAVTDYSALYTLWLQEDFQIPVVAVESGFNESTITLVSADNYGMGKMLGEEILKDFPNQENITVALAPAASERDSVEQREQGFRDVLEGRAKIIPLRVAVNGEGADAAAALDKETFLNLPETGAGSMNHTKYYGIGNSTEVVAALDQGKIDKIIFQNEFNMGYLAVTALLGKMTGMNVRENQEIDYYCVEREKIYDTPYEELLFPIVE